jgi:hypothetical protein
MNPPSTALAARVEAAIRRLRDVEGVSVNTEGDEIREIHVLTSSERPPKNIVRDVQTVLRTGLGLGIDHRVVSVALAQKGAGGVAVAMAAAEPSAPEPAAFDSPAEPVATPSPDRIQFEGVNLFVSGPRTQAQVELRWKGLPRIGSAAGWSARDESHRLVAQAAAAAVQEFLADPVALNVQGVEFETFGRIQVAVVAVSFVAHRQEKMLTGSCAVAHDTPQAVVLATLDALNRVVGGLRVKEPTEYVLRPTSG